MFKYNHDCPFEAYITNLGKYNEGELIGEWVKFPTTNEVFQNVLKEIGIDDYFQDWFISDFDIYEDNIKENLYPYSSFDELNEVANEIIEFGT